MEKEIATLKADMRNVCSSINEMRGTLNKIDDKLDLSAELASETRIRLKVVERKTEQHDAQLLLLEKGHWKLLTLIIMASSGVSVGVSQIVSFFR